MTPGIYDDLARADLPPGLSYSGAKDILKSPFLYRWKRDNPQPSSSAMEVGQALHTAVLGKGARGVRIDGGRGRSEREVEVRAAGDIPLASDDFDNVNAMHAAVTTHDEAGRAVAGAKRREVAAIAQDPETGIWLRAYVDALHEGNRYGLDLKTGREGTLDDFSRTAYNLGYHIQAAVTLTIMEWLGTPLDAFLFVIVESKAPHLVGVRELSESFIDLGREQLARAIALYAKHSESGDWPGPAPYLLVSPPRWAGRETA